MNFSNTPYEQQPVNIVKLQKILRNKDKNSPVSFLDFSKFASENFDQHANLTSLTNKIPTKRVSSKLLYNEVQRNSIYFGVSGSDMKKFYNRGRREPITSEQELKKNINQDSTTPPFQPDMRVDIESKVPVGELDDEKLRFRHRGPIINTDTSPKSKDSDDSSLYLTPKSCTNVGLKTPDVHSSDSSSPKFSSHNSSSPRKNSSSSSVRQVSRLFNKGLSPSGIFNRSPLSKSRVSSMTSLKRSPSQFECHSVEDTLLADEQFKDFTVPERGSRFYDLPIDKKFNFERSYSSSIKLSTKSLIDQNNSKTNERNYSYQSQKSTPTTPTKGNSSSRLFVSSTGSPLSSNVITRKTSQVSVNLDDMPSSSVKHSNNKDMTEEEILNEYLLL